jgi:tetratricopeptide (TPR) repeat protein
MGIAYCSQRNYQTAIKSLQQSLEMGISFRNQAQTGYCHLHLGRVYRDMGEFQQGLVHYQNATEIFTKIHNWLVVVTALKCMAKVMAYHSNGTISDVNKLYLKADEILKTAGASPKAIYHLRMERYFVLFVMMLGAGSFWVWCILIWRKLFSVRQSLQLFIKRNFH